MSNRPVHFEFYSTDPDASVAFFQQALGWNFDKWGDQAYWLASTGTDGPGIDGAVAAIEDGGAARTMNTVDVADLEKAISACVDAGGQTVGDVMDIPDIGRWVQIREPGGNIFGLMESVEQAE